MAQVVSGLIVIRVLQVPIAPAEIFLGETSLVSVEVSLRVMMIVSGLY